MNELKYAGFWLRLGAYLIDSFILQLVQVILIAPFLISLGIQFPSEPFDFAAYTLYNDQFVEDFSKYLEASGSLLFAGFITQVLYFSLLESSYLQGTIGKLIMRIKVTDMKGERLSFIPCLVRNMSKLISGVLLMMGYLMAGFTNKKQALHDLISSALVLRNDGLPKST